MLRRAARHRWSVHVERWDVDRDGRGEVVYRIDAEGHVLRFVVFSSVIDESERSDRVIAERWDVSAALIRGPLTQGRAEQLRREVPRQETGCADAQTLVWTRGNRSARHFDRVVERLAAGHQPDRDALGWSSYVLRSTAYYANGKFGMAGIDALADCPPLAAPYRAQMLSAWLLREFGCDLVEHLAACRDARAVALSSDWRRAIGIGNATGLGMVPFPINHPEFAHAWCSAREHALAAARTATPARVATGTDRVCWRLRRARGYFVARVAEPYAPFRPAGQLADELALLERRARRTASWDELWSWSEQHSDAETQEVLLSCLVDEMVEVDEEIEARLFPTMSEYDAEAEVVGTLRADLEDRYRWALQLADAPDAARHFWYYAADSEEPRRGVRGGDRGELVAMAVDIPAKMAALRTGLARRHGGEPVAQFLLAHPEHRQAAARALRTRALPYAEPRVNLDAAGFLPLALQRFQLATYGAENYIPQSNDWLRVTLMQGAPSRHELASYDRPTNPLFAEEPCDDV